MRYRDKKKLKDSEWQKRILTLPFEDQADHDTEELRQGSKDGEWRMTEELMYPSSAIADICKRKREKLLDELEKRVDAETYEVEDRHNCRSIKNHIEHSDVKRIIEELRQEGKVEQG